MEELYAVYLESLDQDLRVFEKETEAQAHFDAMQSEGKPVKMEKFSIYQVTGVDKANGEAAADPLLEPLLISWGLEEFSMSAPSILRARKTISQWTKAECDELAEKALACNTAAEVKALLESAAR